MSTYIAFLRAVNIGKRAYPMAELRAMLAGAGYEDAETHIQTGNVLVTSPLRSRAKLEAALEKLFLADRGWEVPTIVFTPVELATVLADADEIAAKKQPEYGHYVSLLRDEPTAAGRKVIEGAATGKERVVVRGRAVHLLYDIPFHEAKSSNAAVEKAIGVATNRNLKVIRKLVEKWCD